MNSIFAPFRMGRFVGFDPVFDQLDRFLETATSKVTFPPYNLAKLAEQVYQLQFALAGFSKDEIRVYQDGNYLVVEGKAKDKSGPQMIYQGISAKDFVVKFLLADGVMVDDVALDNGLLSIQIQKPVENRRELEFKIRTPLPNPSSTSAGIDINEYRYSPASYRRSDLMEEYDAESERIRREEEDAEERRAIQLEDEFGSDRNP